MMLLIIWLLCGYISYILYEVVKDEKPFTHAFKKNLHIFIFCLIFGIISLFISLFDFIKIKINIK